MLTFPKDYFLGETRDNFYIEPMMKCAWAAQLEVLEVIREVCEKHNIQYFAAYGTLLGAVRHKGFIPWDDDVDIVMLRKEYDRFWEVASAELPDEYRLLSPFTVDDYPTSFGRVVNKWSVSYDPEQLIKYHGCPYIVGVDICPLDTVPVDPVLAAQQAQITDLLVGTFNNYESDPNSVLELLPDLEELCHMKFDMTKKIGTQLLQTVDRVSKRYSNTNGNFVSFVPSIIKNNNRYRKEWFERSIELPFENIFLPAPENYDAVLSVMYGSNYMTPVREITHDYPFYKAQAEALEKSLVERIMRGEKLV